MKFPEFVTIFFTDPIRYSVLTDYEKRKHFFLLNRRLSIALPKQAQYLNINGIDGERAVDFWYNLIVPKCGEMVPGWFWTKALKKGEQQKKWYPKDKEKLMEYLQYKRISKREFDLYLDIDLDYMKAEYTQFLRQFD